MATPLMLPGNAPLPNIPLAPMGGRFRPTWNVALQTRPDYKFLGYHVTCIPDAVYPWCEADVRFIRAHYDPHFVPIFRRMRYQTPAGTDLDFVHHGVASYDPWAKPDPLVLRLDMPQGRYGASFRHPNVVSRWFENKAAVRPYSKRSLYQLPPPTIHWRDTNIVAWVADCFWEATWEDKARFHQEKDAEHAAAVHRNTEFEIAEAEYRAKAEDNYQKRQWDDIGVDERREIEGRQAGQWEEPRKPFADSPRGRFTGAEP